MLPEAWVFSGGCVGYTPLQHRPPQNTRIPYNNPSSCMRHGQSRARSLRKPLLSTNTPPACPFEHLARVSIPHSKPHYWPNNQKPLLGALKLISTPKEQIWKCPLLQDWHWLVQPENTKCTETTKNLRVWSTRIFSMVNSGQNFPKKCSTFSN